MRYLVCRRHVTLLLQLAAAVAVAAIAVPAASQTTAWGDLDFSLDTAVFARPGGLAIQEVYVRIANAELRFKEAGGRYRANARFWIGVKDDDGKVVVNDKRDLEFYEDDEQRAVSPIFFQTLINKYKLKPGKYELTCRIDDLNSPKVTMLGMIKKKHKSSVVKELQLEVPEYPVHAVSLSDAKFIWSVEVEGTERVQHPNPARMYGLYKDTLQVYLELYMPDTLAVAEGLQFEAVIIDQKGEVVKEALIELPPLEEAADRSRVRVVTYPIMINEDLTVLPAGNYTLYINVGRDNQLLRRVRRGNFNVAWDIRTWETSRKTFLAEARFLLGDEDYRDFARRNGGDQERLLREMWEKEDPDPSTGVNEAYEEFLRRLEYVNARFSDYQMGIHTDRGLIYLKYGPPDEIIEDVVPQNRESISDAFEKIDDRFHDVNFSTRGSRTAFGRVARDVIVDPRRMGKVGEGGDVAYPYELWVYNGKGNPILDRDRALEPDIGMRFIFVDREGYGRYKLESSSSITNK